MSQNSFQLGDLLEMNSYNKERSMYLVTKIDVSDYGSRVMYIENINGIETRIVGERDLEEYATKL